MRRIKILKLLEKLGRLNSVFLTLLMNINYEENFINFQKTTKIAQKVVLGHFWKNFQKFQKCLKKWFLAIFGTNKNAWIQHF